MKEVTAGAHYATVTVDTAEEVKFSFPSTSLSVEAAGGDITVALTETAQAGDDETITVPDGESRMFIHHRMNVDTYYLTGSGTATLYASNMSDVNPFKGKAKGGDGGGDNTHYKGTTTTALENGSTTNPIVIDGESYTAVFGDVVVYGYTEFVFDGTQWSEFGRPFDTVPTRNSSNAVTSDGVYRNTAGLKYYVGDVVRGEIHGNRNNNASGDGSHAEGSATTASGAYSHAEGYYTVASSSYSHAEGNITKATGHHSHAEGNRTVASGEQSHAEGIQTTASGAYSHAGGAYTVANKNASTVIGKYNKPDTDVEHMFIVGNGTADGNRSNILEVSETDMNVNGDIKINNVSIPTPYTTMPTITADMLGKIAQYVGTSDSNYKQGWNYVAVSDGAETPTYSWQALMDTVPTQGSTNAVTSDGIYQRTPLVRGTGVHSIVSEAGGSTATKELNIAIGASCHATGARAIALGQVADATGEYSSAIGYYVTASAYFSHALNYYTVASQTYMTAIGKYNKPRTGDLFNVGNGTSVSNRSNILEVSGTDANVNGDIKVNNVPIPTPYTTMPTITAGMLGKIAMYVGTSDSNYKQGCFYIASTDGAAEPTYSWVKIGGGRTETILWENEGSTNPQTITLSEAWSNFDELAIVTDYIYQGIHYVNTNIKLTSTFILGEVASFWYYDNQVSADYIVASSTTFTFTTGGGDHFLYKIIGIKY